MPSLIAHAVKLAARITIKRRPKSPEALVRHLRLHMNKPPLPTMLPRGVSVEHFLRDRKRPLLRCVVVAAG